MLRRSLLAAALICTPAIAATDINVCTLYRDSVLDPTMRIHVATFDAADGRAYNYENCFVAATLFQEQKGAKTHYWCEPGRYRKTR